MVHAATFCTVSAGAFFLVGLAAGTWKYACIHRSEEARAPFYVDTAHRASLMYAFASALIAELCAKSAWPNAVNLAAAIGLVLFFALAVVGYLIHGMLGDTDNQLRKPHRLGRGTISNGAMLGFMITLALVEIGGFLVIFSGYLATLA